MTARRATLVDTDRGARYELVAADAAGGVLRCGPHGLERLAVGTRLVLESRDPAYTSVRFYVEITRADEERPEIGVRWVLLTATGCRRHLVRALSQLLGLEARLTSAEDELGPHRKLVYQAASRQVRLINVGEALEPHSAVATTPRRDGDARPPWRWTQPSILVEAGPDAGLIE